MAALAVLWAIGNLVLDLRRLHREKSLAAGVAGGKPEDAEAAALQEKLAAAMTTLRKAKRGSLYEQPWYVIIGPPGAGKTTALLNAGLELPACRPSRTRRPGRRGRDPAVRMVVH